MTRTPAGHLAQLKMAWPEWQIWRGERETGFFAVLRGAPNTELDADSVEQLEVLLLDWDKTRNPR